MSEYQGSDIPGWLRQAASSFEEVAHSDVPDLHRRSRESGSLRELVDYAADRLALLRLQNLRESLADVEQVLQGLKQEQEIRRREGRSTRLTEQLIAQADQERTRILRQIASAVEIPGIYSERRRSRESSMEGRSSTEQAITRNFAKFYRSSEERSWTPEPGYYRDEEFDEDPPYYYSRSVERRSREIGQPSREPSATSLRSAASRERPRSTAESASWLSVRVERKSRSSSSPAPLSLGRGPTAPSRETPRPPAPGFSLARTQPIPDSTRRRPAAASSRLEWLGSRVRPADVTAEDLPAIEPDEDLLFSDEDLQDLENLDLGDEELDADVSLEDLDLSDIDLNDLDLDLDLEGLDLEDGLEDLGEVDFDEDELQADLLEPEEAELVDDELADPFLDDLDDELEEDLGLELEVEPEVDLDGLEYLDDDEELEADPTQLDVDLEGLDLEADELDDIDFSDLDLEEEDGEPLDFDLGDLDDLDDLDLEDLDDVDLDLAEIADETEIVTLSPEVVEEEPFVLEAPPVEVEPVVEEEPLALEGPLVLEGPPVEVEPVVEEGPLVLEGSLVLEGPIVLEAPPVEVEPVVEEEPIVLEAPTVVVAPPVEVEPVAEEEPIALEAPPVEVEPVAEEEPIALEAPPVEVEPVVEEEPLVLEAPPVEVEPVADEEPIALEAPPVEVEPVAEEEPIALEAPPVEVEPVAEEEPIELEGPPVEAEPVVAEEPLVLEAPPVEVEPVVEEEPIELEGPPVEAEPVVAEEPLVLEAPPVEAEEALGPPGLELVELEPTEATGFFEGGPLEAAPSFLEGDELFASGELPALEVSAEASVEGDLLTGSVEALEPSGDFFSESFEGDNSWLDAPVADSVDAPEWLKSPDEGFPAIGEAPPLDSPDKVSALEEAPSALEEAIEAASVPGEVASPPPAAVEAPPKPTGASAQERRKLVRLSCSYDLTAYVEGRPVPCKLMDISLGGGKLVGPDGFQRGQLIQVSNPLPEAKTSDPVTARIVWMRPNRELAGKFDLGLQFEESPVALGKSWVITVINKISMSSKMFNQRKYTRAVANMPIEVVLITAERLPGTAIDLGLGGALLAVDRPMTPTTKITLHIGPLGNHDKLELRCEIISSRHDENGRGWTHSVKFNEISTTQTKLLGKYVVDLLKTGGSV